MTTTTKPTMPFRDRFGKLSDKYAKYRPTYPPELYAYLASLCPHHDSAVDLGAGNGQATRSLLDHFAHVLGTDGSQGQIDKANEAVPEELAERLAFKVSTAEDIAEHVQPNSVDLVTVAQAIHWFNLDATYTSVARILRPGGVLAAWTYPIPTFPADPSLQSTFVGFYESLHANKWWDDIIRDYVDNQYANLPFPGASLVEVTPQPRPWLVTRTWALEDLVGFINTWSAVGRAKEAGKDVVAEWSDRFEHAWPTAKAEVQVQWAIHMRVARKPQ